MGKLLDALKAQGVEVTAEVETAVMADFVEKSEVSLKDVEITDLKEQLGKRDTDIEDLKKTAGKDVQEKLTELQGKYDTETASLKAKVEETKLDGALKLALLDAKPKYVELLSGLIKRDALKLDENGKLSGLEDQLKGLKESKAFLFEDVQAAQTGAGDNSGYRYTPQRAADTGTEKVTLKDAVAEAMQLTQ